MIRRWLLACIILLACLPHVAAQVPADRPIEESIGAIADPAFPPTALSAFTPRGQALVLPYRHAGSDFLRLLITAKDLPAAAKLTITGRRLTSGQANVLSFGAGTGQPLDGTILTDLLFGDRATISVTGAPRDAQLTVESVFVERNPVDPQLSQFGGNDLKLMAEQTDAALLSVARATVYLSFFSEGAMEDCSGVVVSDSLILTNDHCVNEAEECATANIIFDFITESGEVRHCAEVKLADHDLDYALLQLDAAVPEGVIPLSLSTAPTPVNQDSLLIQHPLGQPKQVAIVGCLPLDAVVDGRAAGTDFSHRCDTAEGSSGSPVIVQTGDDAWCVVGLHHWGFTRTGFFSDRNRAVQAMLISSQLSQAGFELPTCHVP